MLDRDEQTEKDNLRLVWILTNKKRPAATERSEQIQMEF